MTSTLAPFRAAGGEGPPADGAHGSPPQDPTDGPATTVAEPARRTRPRWELPAFVGMLLGTAALYLWDLSSSGYANSFYSAAAQAGGKSWWAFLWGASDIGASITVDKPPAAIWVMALSVRIFGLSSWSILVPQALMGVASVALLYRIVRTRFGAVAGLLAGVTLALTPVAALMFRFNNPDALLVLLMIAAVWATTKAIDGPRTTRWMVLAGVFVGFGFLTKQLQVFLILPGLALAYLWAGPVSLRKRVRDGLAAVAAMVVAGGWWVALVELWPSGSRPYIGGSQNDSFLELTFGYNGFGRLTGDETGSVGGGGGTSGGQWGATGITRLFTSDFGGQIAWLIPAALALGLAALWIHRRAARTDAKRAQLLIWGSWLVVTALTFSFMAGIFHAYYTVALAPAVAALVGIGAVEVWRRREQWWATGLLAAVTLGSAVWSAVLLERSSDFVPWLRFAVVAAGVVAAVLLIGARWFSMVDVGRAGAVIALMAALAGPTSYTLQTVSTGHTGSIVTAGPSVSGGNGFGGMGGRGGFGGMPGGGRQGGTQQGGGQGGPGSSNGSSSQGGMSTGTQSQTGTPPQTGSQQGGPGRSDGGSFGGGTGIGGLLNGTSVSTEVEALLNANGGSYRWVAAVTGSQNAASYQLATGYSVMPIGGFNGSDPSPTLAQFEQWVAEGQIHYYIASSGMGGSGGSGTASAIATWVSQNFTAQTVDGVTVYDLTTGASS